MIGRHGHRVLFAVALGLCLPLRATAQDVVEYYGTDATGSVRIVFDANGNILGRMDYGPFGEQLLVSTVGHKSYAGLFRDGEAGLDHAEARSYQVRTGRFNAPDPVYAGLFAPQAWNRYSYALNNPISFADPSGELAQANCGSATLSGDGEQFTIRQHNTCDGLGGGGRATGGSDLGSIWLFLSGLGWQARGGGSGRTSEPAGGRGTVKNQPPPAAPTSEDSFVSSGDPYIDVLEGIEGVLDGISAGTLPNVRTWLYGTDPIDTCSDAYDSGEWISFGLGIGGLGRLGYMGAAAGLRYSAQGMVAAGANATAVAEATVQSRNALKFAFRLGVSDARFLDPVQTVARKGAMGAIQSAGKTNADVNRLAYAAGGASARPGACGGGS